MITRAAAAGIVALTLACLTALPVAATAAIPGAGPIRLVDYQSQIGAPPAVAPPQQNEPACDVGTRLYCGSVIITANFAGLNGHIRPQNPGPAVNLYGTVDVIRTYGCAERGKVIHRFDRTVRETAILGNRRNFGSSLPATGDTFSITTFAFLSDRQPFNCRGRLTPVITSIVARNAKLTLDFYSPLEFDVKYNAPMNVSWSGMAPTPPKPTP